MKKTFIELLEAFLPKKSHPCYKLWRNYYIKGVERGKVIISQLASHGIRLQRKLSLDLGCGTGGLSIALKRHGVDVIGLDVSRQLLRITKVRALEENVSLNLVRACGENLPFKPKSFHLIFCIDVIEHVCDPDDCAKEMGRTLNPDGFLYMTAPNAISPSILMKDPHFQLPLISILPLWLAKKYAKTARQIENYDIGKMPTYKFLIKTFKRAGITLFVGKLQSISNKIRNISKIESKKMKWTIWILKKLRASESFMLTLYTHLIVEVWIFVGQKEELSHPCL